MHAQARKCYCRKKLGLLLFTIFTALAYHAIASAAVVVRGQEHPARAVCAYGEGRGEAARHWFEAVHGARGGPRAGL